MYVYESWYNMSQKKIEWFFFIKRYRVTLQNNLLTQVGKVDVEEDKGGFVKPIDLTKST